MNGLKKLVTVRHIILTFKVYSIMKMQQTAKLTKKTVFVYKSIKDQNNFETTPTSDQSQTIATNGTWSIIVLTTTGF